MNIKTVQLYALLAGLLLAAAVALGLFKDHTQRFTMVGHRMPPFDLPSMDSSSKRFASRGWKPQATMLSMFASWCPDCAAEHPVLMRLAQTGKVAIYGIAWKDTAVNAQEWLKANGNPYESVGVDARGLVTIPLGIVGVPTTFLLNKEETVVYEYELPLTDDIVNNIILPLADKINNGELDTPTNNGSRPNARATPAVQLKPANIPSPPPSPRPPVLKPPAY